MKLNILLVSIVMLVAGCSSENLTDQTKTTMPDVPTTAPEIVKNPDYVDDVVAREAEYNQRAPIKKQFLAAAKALVSKGKSQKHTDVYNFIARKGFLALPVPDNCMPVEKPPKDGFAIVVLFPEDSDIQPWSRMLATLGAAASYNTSNRTMILSKELAGSNEGMGITLLHEGYHAYKSPADNTPPETAESFCSGEVETHQFIAELTFKLHPAVSKLVDQAAAMLQTTETDGVITTSSSRAVLDFINSKLDTAYGRPITNVSERGALKMDAFYLANFRSIDRQNPPGGEVAKVAFLKNWLESTGQAQWKH